MEAQQDLTFKALFNLVVGGMAKAVCERNGETKEQQYTRSQAVSQMIMGFLPRDVIELMLAGHCVMLHEMMVRDVHETLRGEEEGTRRVTRAGIVAMDRAFGTNLRRLEHYRSRPAEGRRDAPDPRGEKTQTGTAEIGNAQGEGVIPVGERNDVEAPQPGHDAVEGGGGSILSPAGLSDERTAAQQPNRAARRQAARAMRPFATAASAGKRAQADGLATR